MAYATVADLTARLSAGYVVPAGAEAMLAKASEVIDEATLGRAADAYVNGDAATVAAITAATCDQVEFWLEVGEEHDVTGLRGSMVSGRVQVHPVSPVLSPRARRTLLNAGVMWLGVRTL